MQEEIDEDCSICLELFTLPTQLPCQHVFCRPCLLAIVPRQAACPLCRAPFGLPLRPVDEATAGRVRALKLKQEQLLKDVVAAVVSPPYLRRDEWLVILRMLEKWDGPKAVARVQKDFFVALFADARQVGAVCKGLYRVAQDSCLWRDLCMRDFAFVPSQDDGCKPSWRRRYDAGKRRARGWSQGKPSDWKLSTLRGPASHVTQLVPQQGGRRIGVRYADGTALFWDPRSEQQSPDEAPEAPEQPGTGIEVAPGRTLRLAADGATLQLLDGVGAVLAAVAALGHSAAVRPSFDGGHVVLGGTRLAVYAVSLQVGPLSVVWVCVFFFLLRFGRRGSVFHCAALRAREQLCVQRGAHCAASRRLGSPRPLRSRLGH